MADSKGRSHQWQYAWGLKAPDDWISVASIRPTKKLCEEQYLKLSAQDMRDGYKYVKILLTIVRKP